MNNLPGLRALRMLPLQGALGRYQLWERALAKSLKTQCSGLGTNSNILKTYRSVRCRLMRKMSVAMLRRRSCLHFLERKPVQAATVTNAGCARLPVAMRYYPKTLVQKRHSMSQVPLIMPSSNVWAGLMAQRSFATMNNTISEAKDAKQRLSAVNKRPLVPILEFVEQPEQPKLVKNDQNIIDNMPRKVSSESVSVKHKPAAKSHGSPKQRPAVPTLDFSDQPESFSGLRKMVNASMCHTSIRPRHETEPLPKRQLNAKLSNYALKRSSNLQYLMSKYPLMHKLQSPVMEYLKTTIAIPQSLDTFETRLRALRTTQPLNLRLPLMADRDNLNVTQQYRRSWRPRFANMSGSKRFGPSKSFRSATQVLPWVKVYNKRKMPKKSIQKKKSSQQEKAKKMSKPPVKSNESLSVGSSEQRERGDLQHLLGDLLDNNDAPEKKNVNIEFNKTAPLFKLVTSSVEGRSKLYNRTFNKELAGPQLYQHPTIRILSGSPRFQRPIGFLGQSAVFRAKTLLENKLSMLLNATQESEDDDADD